MALAIDVASPAVFTDLGLPNPEEELLKAQLARRVNTIIGRRGQRPILASHRSYSIISSPPNAAMQSQDTAMSDDIAFSIGESSLGAVLVARSPVGICAILIGSDAEELKSDLAARFPGGKLTSNDATLHADVSKVLRFIDTPREGLDLALDMRGTPFQRRVWHTLRAIPEGAIVTYTELARCIGEPNSARAVARACATNAIALAIPCHRVIRSNGELSGYRWGVERKKALINKEASA